MARRAWFETATPDQRRAIAADDFRRTTEAALFQASWRRDVPSTMKSVTEFVDAERKNPLPPRRPPPPLAPEPTVRGGTPRERMMRAFDRPRTPLIEAPAQPVPEMERRLRAPGGAPAPLGPRPPAPFPPVPEMEQRLRELAERVPRRPPEPLAPALEASDYLAKVALQRAYGQLTGVEKPQRVAGLADRFRSLVPQGVRDFTGGMAQTFIEDIQRPAGAIGGALAEGDFRGGGIDLDAVVGFAQGWMEPGSVNWENIEGVRELPKGSKARGIAATIASIALDPLTWGAVAVTAPKTVAKVALTNPKIAKLIAPLLPGGTKTRLAAETAFGSVVAIGTEEAMERGAHPAIAVAGSMLAGMFALAGFQGLRAVARRIGRDVPPVTERALLPVAPALDVEDVARLTPEERAARGLAEGAEEAAQPPVRPPAEPPPPLSGLTPEERAARGITEADERAAHFAAADPGPPPRGEQGALQLADPRFAAPPAAGEPPRRRPPARGTKGAGESADKVLRRISEQAISGERPDQTLLRRHGAAIRQAEATARLIVDVGSKRLRTLGIGVRREGRLVLRTEDIPEMDELFKALHGEGPPPERLQAVYDELRELTDWEEAARIDFDPAQALVEDYFYRGWKPPEDFMIPDAGGGMRRNPAFRKPRANATYSEMRAAGFEPLHWNPYEQFRVSQLQGERYRQQMTLIEDLKKREIARPHEGGERPDQTLQREMARPHEGGAIPQGWRIPQVGPAFEGKPFIKINKAGDPEIGRTRQWIVDERVANALEGLYGKKPDIGRIHIGSRTVDLQKAVDWIVFIPKRAKLLGTLFQQIDFAARTGAFGWSGAVDRMVAGRPFEAVKDIIRIPRTWLSMAHANLSPGRRTEWRRLSQDTTPFFPDRPGIHYKGVGDAGLSQMDVTILNADIDGVMREVVEESLAAKIVKFPVRAVRAVEGMTRRGLFEGVYPAAIMTDVQYNIAPSITRSFSHLSDEAINGMIARVANIRWSTIPAEQSAVQMRALRETLRRVMFSLGESEGLLRQGTRIVPGRGVTAAESRFWIKHWLGAYLFLTTTASLIHVASTGEALPRDRWSPISKDRWGVLPFGYNRDFASPDIPFTGRSGTQLTLDIVQQMDTVFRVLDPWSFMTARESVPVRALETQLSAEDFYKRPIDTVGPEGVVSRTGQAIKDLFLPIGAGSAVEMARQAIPGAAAFIPEAEGRLGITGSGIQATGFNIRAERTPQLLRRFGITDETEDAERQRIIEGHPELKRELDLRLETAERRGSEGARLRLKEEEVRAELLIPQEAADRLFEKGEIDGLEWRERNTQNNNKLRNILKGLYFERGKSLDSPIENPENPRDLFVNKIIEHTDAETGEVDWDQVEAYRGGLDETENKYIDDNTGYRSTPTQKRYRVAAKALADSGFFDIADQVWHDMQEAYPKVTRPIPLRDAESFYEWRKASLRKIEADLQADFGKTLLDAQADAPSNAYLSGLVTDFNDRRNLIESEWATGKSLDQYSEIEQKQLADSELAEQARTWGLWQPTAPQRGILRGETPAYPVDPRGRSRRTPRPTRSTR